MCSTAQSARARNAFSRACAARTCPAPEVADRNNTRGFVFICPEILRMQEASRCFALARGDFFQNPTSDFLKFPESGEIVLKIVVQELRVLRAELRSQNHVTQFYRMREQRVFLQFLERNLGVVVIHGFPQRTFPLLLYAVDAARRESGEKWRKKSYAAFAAAGMNSYRAILAAIPLLPFSLG